MTVPRADWKFVYRGLANPKVFVWEVHRNGQLRDPSRFPESSIENQGNPFPTQVYIPNAHIVKLSAAGKSFHALDTKGNVHVWGTLSDSRGASSSGGYRLKNKPAPLPLKLQLPNAVRSISSGCIYFMALDNKNIIWNFVNWGRPFRLSSHLMDGNEPLQIECGGLFSSALLKNGDVLVWWPCIGKLAKIVGRKGSEMDNDGVGEAHAVNGVIECYTWTANADPVLLPPLPQLPDIAGLGENYKDNPPRLIQLAALISGMVGLTNQGHVVKFAGLDYESTSRATGWQYLPEFSEVSRIRDLPAFSESIDDTSSRLEPPEPMTITHISANSLHFLVYWSARDSSIVLQGDLETKPETKPHIIPKLQNKNIITTIMSMWCRHTAALTADGKLYTGGEFPIASGLGGPTGFPVGAIGDRAQFERMRNLENTTPPDVSGPVQVRFDHGRKKPKDRFCYLFTAVRGNFGALVIDLEPDESEENDEVQNTGA